MKGTQTRNARRTYLSTLHKNQNLFIMTHWLPFFCTLSCLSLKC